MHIDNHKTEEWLTRLADGVANSNSLAEEVATCAMAAGGLHEALRRLLAAADHEAGVIPIDPDPGCIECTCGVTPNKWNTGLCAYHEAKAALRKSEGL